MSMAFARAASIAGHPLPVLSLTLLALAFRDGADQGTLVRIGIGLALYATVLLGYSWWRVRAGHWRHVDASQTGERQQLNRVLLGLILAGAALAAVSLSMMLALQLALASLPIVLALLTSRWCTLSLHLAFIVYASALLAPVSTAAAVALLLFAAVLAWSRLRLARHSPRDLVAGASAGAVAGLLAWAIPQLPAWQG
jgi:membrane-associated phospholipid phosphatase